MLRTSSLRAGSSPTPSPPRKKQTNTGREGKENSRTVCLIKTHVIEFGNEATWSTRRAGRAPGTPFSWATCDEMKVAALPRSRDQDDGRGQRRPERRWRSQRVMTILVLLPATVLLPAVLLREVVKGTEQSCYAQAEVLDQSQRSVCGEKTV